MTPRSKADWSFVLTAIEWFRWLISNHTASQIVKAMRAATETLP